LPERALLKMVIDTPGAPGVIYETEIEVYRNLLPDLDIEKPIFLGGTYDEKTERFALLLEDLTLRGATFPNALETDISIDRMKTTLKLLAKVHAFHWNSPHLDKPWLSTLVDGKQFDFMDANVVPVIEGFLPDSAYKRGLLARLGRDTTRLWDCVKAVDRHHHETLPLTLQHGDTGVHNSYDLPGGGVGMLDWQLSVRGTWPRDIHYIIITGLTIEDRRAHERELVAFYLNELATHGVKDLPSLDEAMKSYGLAVTWGFTVGWLMAGDTNYGPEILAANLDRLIAAAEDHDSFARAEALMR